MKRILQLGHQGKQIELNYLLNKKYVLIVRNWIHFKKRNRYYSNL